MDALTWFAIALNVGGIFIQTLVLFMKIRMGEDWDQQLVWIAISALAIGVLTS
jgi:hypothetical protein